MNATVTCEKCGKPLGMFNGKICYECEKKAHEDFKRYCTENNYVPLTTEMYSRAIKAMDVLEQIRDEIKAKIEEEEFARSVFRHEEKDAVKAEQCTGSIMAYNNVIKFIDKYKEQTV